MKDIFLGPSVPWYGGSQRRISQSGDRAIGRCPKGPLSAKVIQNAAILANISEGEMLCQNTHGFISFFAVKWAFPKISKDFTGVIQKFSGAYALDPRRRSFPGP